MFFENAIWLGRSHRLSRALTGILNRPGESLLVFLVMGFNVSKSYTETKIGMILPSSTQEAYKICWFCKDTPVSWCTFCGIGDTQ